MTRVARTRAGAEWVTFGASLAVLAVLIGTIIALWVRGESPARLVVREEGVSSAAGAYHVAAIVSNEGDATAANVQVLATLTIDGEVSEGEQVVDFLGGDEQATLVFVFADDPGDGELDLVVASFVDP